MALNFTETNSLEFADLGEPLTVAGSSVTGVFIEGTAKRDDLAPDGIGVQYDAIARVPSATAVSRDDDVVRASDSTTWRVNDIDDSYGVKRLMLQRAGRVAIGGYG